MAQNIKTEIPAHLKAFLSLSVNSLWSTTTSPLYSPSLGSIIFSVIKVPKIVIKNVDAAIK